MRSGQVYEFSKAKSGFAGDGGPVAGAEFSGITGVTVDENGNWVLADQGNHRIRVVAARSGRFYGITMKAMGVYTVAGDGSALSDSGDGGQATRAELGLDNVIIGFVPPVFGVATDRSSNVFVSDAAVNKVRVVAGRSGTFFGQRMRAGDIYTIAGTGKKGDSVSGALATRAEIDAPQGLAVDQAGNVLFADSNGRVQVVAATTGTFYGIGMQTGHIYAIAGGGAKPLADGVRATAASIAPAGVTVDGDGNVLITDNSDFGSLWVLPAKSGTYYGEPMIVGGLYLVASRD